MNKFYKNSISVIIPIKITSFRKDIIDRLEFCYQQYTQNIEYIVVDDGSLVEDAELLKKKCNELGYKYVSTECCQFADFNLARARNIGAKIANGKYVLFLDVDLLVYPGLYEDLQTEIELFDIEHNSDIFLMLPVVYFNDKGLEKYKEQKDSLKKHFALQILLGDEFDLIEKYSYGTSCILVDRLYYLSIGGQDERYEGWGYEDYDFTTKMMKLSSLFPTSTDFESMKGNFMTINRYSGWKAEYRLYGMWMARKGIYLYHVPHEIDTSYHNYKNKNLQLLKKSLSTDFSNSFLQTIEPDCEKSLLLSANPFCCDYKLNTILGKYKILDITSINNWKEILNYFRSNDFTQIVFPNPYGNSIFLELYNYCRSNDIKYIICERGALPGSVYHDQNGFLFDSSSYNSVKWDHPLSESQEIEIKKYISTLRKGVETLESQPQKLTRELTLTKLGIDEKSKKIILIILQTKNDTVIKFFGRDFKTQESLKVFLEKLVEIGKNEYSFIYKNHPLESSLLKVEGTINADDFHINDLIDVCDVVVTINSGAGLIAALLGKPVFTLGDCWYTLPGIAIDVKDENDFFTKLNTFNPLEEKLLRFAYYLRFNFYSFGKHHTILHTKKNSKINATTKIDYTEVQTFNHGRIYFKDISHKVGFESILFKEYDADSLIEKKNFLMSKTITKILNNKKLQKFKRNKESFFKDSKIKIFQIIGYFLWK